ncbi:MAG: PadR family transcriptional regulator [Chloroflexi bacterium]|jgi:PadR family transcriptional regulator, regulatory protein PadR|nr:PadR family transcriptional regulator [Chloroflexota bacterium]MBT3670989.1 PadR family transcriptional regulator [Chloroflexota bacterium]MBT4003194.1 PadR family transcriptional regulator [Chloroflexota bacterium]MBT4305022.1 PadR family transcriptional regulator [Chloroflexota bacterium]MBT4533833.1 PadR family transcriptional regulator [Chloroflexota bacterium]
MTEINVLNKKFQKEINSGVTSLVLLSVMAQAEEPLYGYQIAKQLSNDEQNAPAMKQGALYPVLRSLEKGSLLKSMVEPSASGPPRRYYSITSNGRKILTEWIKLWEKTKSFVDNTLGGE